MSAIFFEVSVSRQNDGTTYAWQGEPDLSAPYESQAECLADMTQADEIVSLDEALERGLIDEDPRGRTYSESFMESPSWFVGVDGQSAWVFAVCSRERLYMNPNTGSVATQNEWRFTDEAGQQRDPIAEGDGLIEVIPDGDGGWIEAE